MKEVLAFIRINKINATKRALLEAGFPSMTCRNCMGRGKQMLPVELADASMTDGLSDILSSETFSESIRLIPKRAVSMILQNDDVDKVINIIMDVNSFGNKGDGKIFVLPVLESIRIRDGESQDDNETY